MKLVRTKKKASSRSASGESRSTRSRASEPDRLPKEESLFRRYLRDVNTLQVMAPEQEFELARQIEGLRIDLWRAVLSCRGGASIVLDAIERLMPDKFEGWDAYRKAVSRSAPARKTSAADGSAKPPAKPRANSFERRVEEWAAIASEADPECLFVDEIVDYLMGLPPPAVQRFKGWAAYRREVSRRRFILRRAKNDFVKANLRLVVAVAARYSRELLSFEDLVQEGNIGLMKAVDRYDYRRGFRFSTYASWWIRHAIGRALADKARIVRLPVHVLDSQQKVEKVRRTLAAQMGRRPTAEEISSSAGIPIEEVEKVNSLPSTSPVSLDEPFSDEDDDRSRLDSLADPEPGPMPIDKMEAVQKEKAMLRLMSSLKPVEVDILQKRFGLLDGRERTLQEIGDEHALSRERIRQVQDRALNKLRANMSKMFAGDDGSAAAVSAAE